MAIQLTNLLALSSEADKLVQHAEDVARDAIGNMAAARNRVTNVVKKVETNITGAVNNVVDQVNAAVDQVEAALGGNGGPPLSESSSASSDAPKEASKANSGLPKAATIPAPEVPDRTFHRSH